MTNKYFGKILGAIVLLVIGIICAINYEAIIPMIGASLYIIIGITLAIIGGVLVLSEEEDC